MEIPHVRTRPPPRREEHPARTLRPERPSPPPPSPSPAPRASSAHTWSRPWSPRATGCAPWCSTTPSPPSAGWRSCRRR
ncbi:hypothetical protein NKH77_03245 [Streptomyces sp. M19]